MLDLTCKFNRPASLHSRWATNDILKLLKKYEKEKKPKNLPNLILHSYAGNKENTKGFLKLQFPIYFSLSLMSINSDSMI